MVFSRLLSFYFPFQRTPQAHCIGWFTHNFVLLTAEEVLLENVELILEAFEYLQLPIALKQGDIVVDWRFRLCQLFCLLCFLWIKSFILYIGRVGKLSIKIPWKKLGRDPIIIMLEDVFVCASQRNDQEVLSLSSSPLLYTWQVCAINTKCFHGHCSGVQMWLRKESLLVRKLSLLLQNWQNCPGASSVSKYTSCPTWFVF